MRSCSPRIALVHALLLAALLLSSCGEAGNELTNAALDVCHGHTHVIEWDGKATMLYHYHATREYPYTLGCYAGTPVAAEP